MLVCPCCGSNILYGVDLVPELPIMVGCDWCGNLWIEGSILKHTLTQLFIMGIVLQLGWMTMETSKP